MNNSTNSYQVGYNINEPPPYDVSDYLEGLTPPIPSTSPLPPPLPPRDNTPHRNNPFLSTTNGLAVTNQALALSNSTAQNSFNLASSHLFPPTTSSISRPSASVIVQPNLNHSHSAPFVNSISTGSSESRRESGNNNNDDDIFDWNLPTSSHSNSFVGQAQGGGIGHGRATSETNVFNSLPGNEGMNRNQVDPFGISISTSSSTGNSSGPRRVSAPATPAKNPSTSPFNSSNRPSFTHSTSSSTSSPSSPFIPSVNFSLPISTPLPSIPKDSFNIKLDLILDSSFDQLERLQQKQQVPPPLLSSNSSKPIVEEEVDPLTSAFLHSFPSLDERQSPTPSSAILFSTEPSSGNRGGELKEDMKSKIMNLIREEFESKGMEMEREIRELKESNLLGMKNLLTSAQERDKLASINNELLSEISKVQSSHSEDLSNAANNSVLLQERIDILQIALNEETSHGNDNRQQSQQGVEVEGDNIWGEIVDEQSKALAKHTLALTTINPTLTCSICSELFNDPTTLQCGHTACKVCLMDWMVTRGNRSCPECRVACLTTTLNVNFVLRDVVNELKKVGLGEEED